MFEHDVPLKLVIVFRQDAKFGVYGYGSEGREMVKGPFKTLRGAEQALRNASSDCMLDVRRTKDGHLVAD